MRIFTTLAVVLLAARAAPAIDPDAVEKKKPEELTVDLGGGVTMEFVLVPAGEFLMGSPPTEKGRDSDEGPQHRVQITKPFYLARHEVTVGHFKAFVAATGYKTDAEKGGGGVGIDFETSGWSGWSEGPQYTWRNTGFPQTDSHPVVNVSWNDAAAFCKWLGGKEGGTYRLPTEAEWEYTCRAGTQTAYYHGDDAEGLAAVGNLTDEIRADDDVFTVPVGQFKPNNFGLYDMHGNVWEWCQDGKRVYGKSPVKDPQGPAAAGAPRVLRGGGWGSYPSFCRSAGRYRGIPVYRYGGSGFRVLRVR